MAGTALQRFMLPGLTKLHRAASGGWSWGEDEDRCDLDEARASRELLDKLIEAEIIPRLMLVNRESVQALSPPAAEESLARGFTPEEVDRFARHAIVSDPDQLMEEINTLFRDGFPHEVVLLELLAPAARRLGKLWDEDACDFADVTIGLMKLHRVLQQINADAPAGMGVGGSSPRIILAPAPGEKHIFGMMMVAEFFARSGWRVHCESKSANAFSMIAEQHFDVVGFSASCTRNAQALSEEIRRIRGASVNPDVIVMAGGPAFNEDVGLARRIGADATAADGVRAVVTAERMVHRLQRAEGAPQS